MDDLNDFKKPGSMAQSELFTQILSIMIREGITQRELAARLNVSPAAVTQTFKRPQSVTLERAEKIARALGFSLHVYLTPEIQVDEEGQG